MATGAAIGYLTYKGAEKQAEAQVEAAQIQAETAQAGLEAAQAQQAQQLAQSQALADPALQAQQTQLALLGQSGTTEAKRAAERISSSPLAQAIMEQNQGAVQAQAAASGVSGGNLLTALQQANQSALLQGAFQGLGQVAGQQQSGALGYAGLGQQSFGMGLNQQNLMGQALGQGQLAQGALAAAPFLAGSQTIQQQQQFAIDAASAAASAASVAAGAPTGAF